MRTCPRTFRYLGAVWLGVVAALLFNSSQVLQALEPILPLRTTAVVQQAIDRVSDDPRVRAIVGDAIEASWSIDGYVNGDGISWAESQVWIPVSGLNRRGTIYARAARASGPWVYTALEFRPDHGTVVDFLDVAPAPIGVSPRGPVYVVHIGAKNRVRLDALPEYFREHLGLAVTLLPALPLDPSTIDEARQQVVAERLGASIRKSVEALVADPAAIVVGVVEDDMYIEELAWDFAFSWRGDRRLAVVATERLGGPSLLSNDPDPLQTRVRKLITKNIGILAYNLPLSSEPTSVLYGGVLSVADIDLMQERFDGLGRLAEVGPVVITHKDAPVDARVARSSASGPTSDGSYACYLIRPGAGWDGVSPIDAALTRCLPGLRADREFDEFEIDLRSGLLVTRQTDLFVADLFPIAFTRCYRLWDSVSRAFGTGWNHPYDILPTGSRHPYTDVDLIMPDGDTIHYDRISEGTGYADAVYEHTATATPFLHSEIRWNGGGWDLRFPDGSLFLFPENYAGTRPHHGAPTAMRNSSGHAIALLRDRDRNLQQLTSPSGQAIRLEHDHHSRVTAASDERGRTMRYSYDAGGRLREVASGNDAVRYQYIDRDLVAIDSSLGRTLLRVQYDDGRRVSRIELGDGRWFRFTYVVDEVSHAVIETRVQAPDGAVSPVVITAPGRR